MYFENRETHLPSLFHVIGAFLFMSFSLSLLALPDWRPLLITSVSVGAIFILLFILKDTSFWKKVPFPFQIVTLLGAPLYAAYMLEIEAGKVDFFYYTGRIVFSLFCFMVTFLMFVAIATFGGAKFANDSRDLIRGRGGLLSVGVGARNALVYFDVALHHFITNLTMMSIAISGLLFWAAHVIPATYVFFIFVFAEIAPLCFALLVNTSFRNRLLFRLPSYLAANVSFTALALLFVIFVGYTANFLIGQLFRFTFEYYGSFWLPDYVYGLYSASPLELPMLQAAEGTLLAVVAILALAWCGMVWRRRAWKQAVAVAILIAGGTVLPELLESYKSLLVEWGARLTLTPSIILTLAVPAVLGVVVSSLKGIFDGGITCAKCGNDEHVTYANFCGSCGERLESRGE